MSSGLIRIRGARQHNLKNLDLDIRTGEMTVVTGPTGSGRSSLVFDTLYAEGQRRSGRDLQRRAPVPRPHGPPGGGPRRRRAAGEIAIDQTNPVRSEPQHGRHDDELNDHLKLLWRAAQLFDRETAQPVRHDTPETITPGAAAWRARPPRTRGSSSSPSRRTAGQHERRADRAVVSASGYTRW